MTTWTQTVDDAPVVDAASAQESASRLYRVSSLAEAGGGRLQTTQAPSWTGEAQQAYDGALADASGGFLAVDEAANRLGRAVDTYARDVPAPLRRWRDLLDDIARARAHPVAPGPDGVLDPSAQARIESDLLADIEVQKRRFRQATADLVSHADAITQGLDTVRGIEDHIEEGFEYLVGAQAETVVAGAQLALGWIHDPGRWRDQVVGVAVGLVMFASDPLQGLRDASGEQAYRDGDYGVAATQSAMLGMAGYGVLRHILRDGVLEAAEDGTARGRRSGGPEVPPTVRGTPMAPLLLPQTTSELLNGVDLRRQETQPGAHTIARHVGWTDDDLLTRSESMSTKRRPFPGPASTFPDLPTAERAVDRALVDRRAEVDTWLTGTAPQLVVTCDVGDVGEVVGTTALRLPGEDLTMQQTSVTVVLRRDAAGNAYVYTAYPG